MIFKNVRIYAFLAAMLLSGGIAFASSSPDTVLMTVDGHPVSLAEFEYFYVKDNLQGAEHRMGVKEYLPLFINYRLKIQAARDAGLTDFSVGTGGGAMAFDDAKAYDRYLTKQRQVAGMDSVVKTAHILVRMDQMVTAAMQRRAREKADSIIRALRGGADFAELAHRCSDDRASARQGGVLPWTERGQTVMAFEDAAFSMQVGTICTPVRSEFGYHIIRLDDKRNAVPYEACRAEILHRMEADAIRERIVESPTGHLSNVTSAATQRDEAEWRGEESELRDALLLNAISDREVWRKAASDKEGLRTFFAQNKKKMKYKGKEADDVVLADYQDYLERQWVTSLRARYRVNVDLDALVTVNKH